MASWCLVPHGIGASWRECDTQAIARNFVRDGFDPLHPRVDWRGDGDGSVECEFPLYQLAVAGLLSVSRLDAEWPGRLLSLLATCWAAWSVYRLLDQRVGAHAALAGLLVFLCAGSTVLVATRVMPDALSLALGVAGLLVFVRYIDSGSGLSLLLAAVAVTVSALQKMPSLQLGLVLFGWVVVAGRHRLRELRLWCAFACVLFVVGAWLWHGRVLHAQTGLSFGVLGDGDTKFPTVDHLLSPKVHAQLAWTSVQYGFGVLGLVGLVGAVAARRLVARDVVLLLVVLAGLYVSLRYSYHHGIGPHYHVFGALAAAWCAACAWPHGASRGRWIALLVLVLLHGGWRFAYEHRYRTHVVESPLVDIAESLREWTAPEDLLVVRAEKPRVDTRWGRRNNYEDPRLLYCAERRGWVLPADGFEVETIVDLHRRGARVVYDPLPGSTDADVSAWLEAHGETVIDLPNLRVHRLDESQ